MNPKPLASLNHFTVPVIRSICSLLLACTFPTASSFALTPPLNGGTLIEAFSLHVLKQPCLRNLTAEFLQHRFQPIRLVHRDFHVALPSESICQKQEEDRRRQPRSSISHWFKHAAPCRVPLRSPE